MQFFIEVGYLYWHSFYFKVHSMTQILTTVECWRKFILQHSTVVWLYMAVLILQGCTPLHRAAHKGHTDCIGEVVKIMAVLLFTGLHT